MQLKPLKFTRNTQGDFISTLRTRVDDHFSTNGMDRTGDSEMKMKSVVMLLLYFVPYGLILSGWFTSPLQLCILWLMISIGMAGIGLGIMHDANHGAYSKNSKINNF